MLKNHHTPSLIAHLLNLKNQPEEVLRLVEAHPDAVAKIEGLYREYKELREKARHIIRNEITKKVKDIGDLKKLTRKPYPNPDDQSSLFFSKCRMTLLLNVLHSLCCFHNEKTHHSEARYCESFRFSNIRSGVIGEIDKEEPLSTMIRQKKTEIQALLKTIS